MSMLAGMLVLHLVFCCLALVLVAVGRVSQNGASAPTSIVDRTVEVRKDPVALKSFDEWRKTEKAHPIWRYAAAESQRV